MRTGVYFVLQVKKSQLIHVWELHMANFNEYKRQSIISVYSDGCRTPTIARIQTQESLPASRQGIQKFLKNIESGTKLERTSSEPFAKFALKWKHFFVPTVGQMARDRMRSKFSPWKTGCTLF